jgi:O-antigen/teichoic acid export membrane protein
MRTKRTVYNTASALMLQAVTILCAFILPRFILTSYGSSYNGITSSITQFISCIALFRAGVGGVTRASLYAPLARGDIQSVSQIVRATEIHMRKITLFFACGIVVFASAYPLLVRDEFDWWFASSLVLIMSLGIMVQNSIGITYQMLLQADQRQYVNASFTAATTALNTLAAVLIIKGGYGIHLVKSSNALIYLISALSLYYYTRRKYRIDPGASPNNVAIRQRWDAFWHQIAWFVTNNTDVIVITVFCNIREVSVYTVYRMVVAAIQAVVTAFSEGIDAAFGNMMAKGENAHLANIFKAHELFVHMMATALFCTTAALIVPFVGVYTKGITDVNYLRPAFGYCLTAGFFIYCVRIPYKLIVDAAGHFKQTRNGAMIESAINVAVSVLLVVKLGIIGVAIGSICAMLFRTIQYGIYVSRNLVKRPLKELVRRFALTAVCAAIVPIVLSRIPTAAIRSYSSFLLYGGVEFLIACAITVGMNLIFYRSELSFIAGRLFRMLRKARSFPLSKA